MAFNGKYETKQGGIDEIISERGDMFLALREVRWSENKPFKLDLRHYKSDEEGDKTLKGVSFTDDDADIITDTLIRNGFGDNDELAETIAIHRKDLFRTIQNTVPSEEEVKDDARKRLFSKRATENDGDEDYNKEETNEDDDVKYYHPEELLY